MMEGHYFAIPYQRMTDKKHRQEPEQNPDVAEICLF